MKHPMQHALEFVDAADAAKTLLELKQAFGAALRPFGAPFYTIGALGRLTENGAAQFIALIRGTPDSWSDHYWERKGFNIDAAFHLALKQATPFSWTQVETSRLSKASASLFGDIRAALHIDGGYVIPLHDERGICGLVALYLAEREPPPTHTYALRLMSITAFERAKAMVGLTPDTPPACPLSLRQREILAFAAAGKTEVETADKLNLSDATVREHLKNVRSHLGVRTKTQAVAIALHNGWIVL